jgi:mevalonate kinase
LGAKLAGAGGGGTIIALHPEPDLLADQLRDEGVELTFRPRPVRGVCLDDELPPE